MVLKQVLEVVIPTKENAFAFQKELGQICKEKLEPALEKLFDSYSTPDEILQIDLLEINLGKHQWLPSGDSFVEAVVKAVEEQIRLKISNEIGNGKITRKPTNHAIFEKWVYFIENGYFPQNATKPAQADYLTQIPEILQKNPAFKKQLVEVLGKSSRGLERFIKQHPESFLERLYAVLSESRQNKLEEYKKEIQKLVDTYFSSSETSQKVSLAQTFWKWIFEYICQNFPTRIKENKLITGFLEHWIRIQKPVYQSRESSLRLTLRTILQESTGGFPLLASMRDQLAVTVFSERNVGLKAKSGQGLEFPDAKAAKNGDVVKSLKQIKAEKPSKEVTLNFQGTAAESPENAATKKSKEKENRENSPKRTLTNPGAKDPAKEPKHLADNSTSNVDLSMQERSQISEEMGISDSIFPPVKQLSEHQEGSFWYVNHAGVVLLHTFFPLFFEKCGIIRDKQFLDDAARERAAQLLFSLSSGQEETPESDMVLTKFLCGIPLEIPVNARLQLSEPEKCEIEKLLKAAIGHWGKLQNASPDALREGFLQREGKLEKRSQGWFLVVEQKSIDILLNYLPWNLRMIKLPWMKEMLRVEWG